MKSDEEGICIKFKELCDVFEAHVMSMPLRVIPVQIFDLENDRYKLNMFVMAHIEKWGEEEFVASMPDLLMYGNGFDERTALSNLKGALVSLYEDYRNTDLSEIGRPLCFQVRAVRKIIGEVR